jgi:uncharacterized protein
MNANTLIPVPRYTRRSFLRFVVRSTLATSFLTAGGTLYTTLLEPAWLKTERIRVPIANLPAAFEGYRIVQLSDLHIYEDLSEGHAHNAVRVALDLAPDMIVITGDFVSEWVDAPRVLKTILPLTAPDGVWAIMGNHDHWVDVDAVRQVISGTAIRELRNESVAIQHGGESLWLAGVDDIWEEFHDLSAALRDVPQDAPLVLLAHEPDYADEVYPLGRVSLQLSGHSHGGQLYFPVRGAPFAPHLGQKYVRGLHKLGNMWLYTNRGVGNFMSVRFNCRPEVTEITLMREVL